MFFFGAFLLGGMLWSIGLPGIYESFRLMGPWIFPFLLLTGMANFIHALAWVPCFPGERLPIRFWQLYLAREAGAGMSNITPTTDVGGEVFKVLLLEPLLPRKLILAAVVIDKASISVAKMAYLSLGLAYLMHYLPLPWEVKLSLAITVGLISLGVLMFVAFQKYGVLARILPRLEDRGLGEKWVGWITRHLLPVEEELVEFYKQYPGRFVLSLSLHFSSYIFRIFRTYILFLLLLGADAPGFKEAAMVTVAVAALDQMFFFVPGRVGTMEGARYLVLTMLGATQAYGLAYALVSRVDQLVWSGVGLAAYGLCTRLFPRTPVLRTPSEKGTEAEPIVS